MLRSTELSRPEICILEHWSDPRPASLERCPLWQIVDNRHLRLVVPVPEAYVGEMQVGQQVAFTVPAYPSQTFHAPITRISHDVDLNTRTIAVELDVRSSEVVCLPQFQPVCNGRSIAPAPTMLVPVSAVTNDNNAPSSRECAMVRRNGGCGTGPECGRQYKVFRDLKVGDEVIRMPQMRFVPDRPVKN